MSRRTPCIPTGAAHAFTEAGDWLVCRVCALRIHVGKEIAAADAPEPWKLRALADWLDIDDQRARRTGTDVQDDLRRWADALEAVARG